MLKIGMIGAGFVARFHERALRSVRNAELAGIYALKGAEALAQVARQDRLGDTKAYGSIAELVRAVDVVCVFAPNFARVEMMREIAAAVEGGTRLKGIIIEKPLARNFSEADTLVRIAKAMNVPTAYFENQIHMPAVVQARAQLAQVEKAMGPAHLARSAEEHGGPHEPWFWDPTTQGGGVCCDMGCHSIACGMYMVTPSGKPMDYLKPLRVNATMALLKWGKEPWLSQLKKRGVDYSADAGGGLFQRLHRIRGPGDEAAQHRPGDQLLDVRCPRPAAADGDLRARLFVHGQLAGVAGGHLHQRCGGGGRAG